MKNGFLYLVAMMDWAARKVLSWQLSNTLDASFCVEELEEATTKYGKLEIMNTDQGNQSTGTDWITTLTKAEIKISMDGRGRYLHRITNGFQTKRIIDDWIVFYNAERPHNALDKRTPNTAYFTRAEIPKAA